MKLRIHRLAEARQPGLGAELEDELEAVFATILQLRPDRATMVT